jgi:DNA-binding SARP family transcriptional activator
MRHQCLTGDGNQREIRTPAVIRTKVTVPALPREFVERARVDDLLAALVRSRRTTVVCATAGAGKTTAVVSALRGTAARIAWLTVDRTDVAPGRLVTYIEAALAVAHPMLDGVATSALAAGIPHAEAAGLLVEAVPAPETILVLDELERLEESRDAWAVIEAVVRYAPAALRLVLLSRRDIPTALCGLPMGPDVAALREHDLAFTAAEAEDALARLGMDGIDAAEVMRATGGWVTGVLFEAWRSTEHVSGAGGEDDPLYGYLSSHILDRLAPPDRDFLVATSLLSDVDAASAAALGLPSPAAHLSALRAAHIPVSWSSDGRVMRVHSRFREYLLEQLERRPDEDRRRLRMAHAALLAELGLDEEACEGYLQADAVDAARAPARRAILGLIDRLDLAVAERWLNQFEGGVEASPLATAELMIALLRDDIGRGIRIADRLAELGERATLAVQSDVAAGLMAWCYLHAARLDEVDAVLAAATPGPATDIVRFAMAAVVDAPDGQEPVEPPDTGGPLDALISAAKYFFGNLDGLVREPPSPWADVVVSPWQIGALRATGHTELALELYEEAVAGKMALPGLLLFIGPELLIDAGRREAAVAAIAEGRRLARRSGSLALQGHARLVEAKLALVIDHDPAAARRALGSAECRRATESFRFIAEVADCRYGYAYLLEGDNERAVAHLRRGVAGMCAGRRHLELPTAAIHLAEAEWRAGEEDAADAAADLALAASRHQGSNHMMLRALVDFPSVLSRRLDAEAGSDSAWHRIGRALLVQGSKAVGPLDTAVELFEFGTARIVAGGVETRPKIAKSYALLAYLGVKGGGPIRRDELFDALFDGRKDDSARAYLRQAIRHLRACLPGDAGLEVTARGVSLAAGTALSTESVRFEARLVEAARLEHEARFEATLEALAIYEQGEYLGRINAPWVAERRSQLDQLAADARFDAAEVAFSLGLLERARPLVEAVLTADPYHEPAWRLSMRLANAFGSEERVIRDFHRCEQALADVGAVPSPATRQLLETLRR